MGVGVGVGVEVGAAVGVGVGAAVGLSVGVAEGVAVAVGPVVGVGVGPDVGVGVGPVVGAGAVAADPAELTIVTDALAESRRFEDWAVTVWLPDGVDAGIVSDNEKVPAWPILKSARSVFVPSIESVPWR